MLLQTQCVQKAWENAAAQVSLTIVSQCLALEDNRPSCPLSVTVCSRTLFLLSLTLPISHGQVSLSHTHILGHSLSAHEQIGFQ